MTAEAVVDLDPIIPETGMVTVDGIRCRVRRMKTREVFALARVLGNGLGMAVLDADLDMDDPSTLRAQVMGILLIAVPNVPDEVIGFVREVLEPVDADRKGDLRVALSNPEFDVLLETLSVVLDQEQGSLVEWLGKATALAKAGRKLMRDHQSPAAAGPVGLSRDPST
jgi:hypothetical protein